MHQILEAGVNMEKLSVLICSLPERGEKLQRLMQIVHPQLDRYWKTVRFYVNMDTEISIGAKRNKLVNDCAGEYCCFLDDDDLISLDYLEKITEAIESGSDCIGINGIITFNNQYPRHFFHTIEVDEWYTNGHEYYRTPNHLNPIKRDIVKQVMFNANSSFGEDIEFSKQVKRFLHTETLIDSPIYYYLYQMKPGENLP